MKNKIFSIIAVLFGLLTFVVFPLIPPRLSIVNAETESFEKTLSYIYIHKKPEKMIYDEGESFDPTGMVVMASYNDGSVNEITEYQIGQIIGTGYVYVTITYENKTTELQIKVNKLPQSLSLTESSIELYESGKTWLGYEYLPDDAVYFGIDWETSDSSIVTVDEHGNVTAVGAGDATITAYISGHRTICASCVVKVKPNKICRMDIASSPTKKTYFEGEELSLDGLKINAYYNLGFKSFTYNDIINIPDFEIICNNDKKEGVKTVTIKNGDVSTSINVTYIKKSASNVMLTSNPNKRVYNFGEKFDPTGMSVCIEVGDITYGTEEYTVSGGGKSGLNPITISCYGATTEIMIYQKSPDEQNKTVVFASDLNQSKVGELTLTNDTVLCLDEDIYLKYISGDNTDRSLTIVGYGTLKTNSFNYIEDYTQRSGSSVTVTGIMVSGLVCSGKVTIESQAKLVFSPSTAYPEIDIFAKSIISEGEIYSYSNSTTNIMVGNMEVNGGTIHIEGRKKCISCSGNFVFNAGELYLKSKLYYSNRIFVAKEIKISEDYYIAVPSDAIISNYSEMSGEKKQTILNNKKNNPDVVKITKKNKSGETSSSKDSSNNDTSQTERNNNQTERKTNYLDNNSNSNNLNTQDTSGSSTGNSSGGQANTSGPSYSNEWVDGRWYDANGNQTYDGTLSWKCNSTGWWVEDSAGWYPVSSWQKIDGIWYYFDSAGYMAAGEYYNGYWFNSDGSWNETYYLTWKCNAKGWWVEDKSGWWPSSSWLKIDGKWYYFDGSGYMVTNKKIDGYWLGADGACQ